MLSAAICAVKAKRSRMRKAVKNIFIFCDLCGSEPVIFLIQEETRLLSVLNIYRISYPVLNYLCNTGIIFAAVPAFALLKAFLLS